MTIANPEQAAAWDGDEGARWAENAAQYESSSQHLWRRFREAVEIEVDARVLDIGCGPGSSTLDAARAASQGSALGVDLSSRMLTVGRERAQREGITNVTFEQADAQVHPFAPQAFDLAISRFGVMFFSDPVAAFTNIARGVRAGGALAMLVWRELPLNRWVAELLAALAFGRTFPAPPPEAPGPFSFADPDRMRAILEHGGFSEVTFDPIDEPFVAGRDLDQAFTFVRSLGIVQGLTTGFDDAQLQEADTALRDMLARHATEEGVTLPAAAWLVRAKR